jgi:adenylate cyclase class IV
MPKARELKIRVDDMNALLARLEAMGAKRGDHLHVTTTYFRQPLGEVLKLSQDETGTFLVQLKAANGGFELLSTEVVDDVDTLRAELTEQYGEKSVLVKEEIYFTIPEKSYVLDLTLIPGVGEFLVIQDDDPHLDIVRNDLGIANPVTITVPFDELS